MSAQNDLNRAKRKLLAIRRAERRLIHRLDDIDWELDALKPQAEALEQGAAQGELPEFTVEKDED